MWHGKPFAGSAATWTVAAVIGLAVAAAGYLAVSPSAEIDVPTVEVSRGAVVEVVELRGEIRPVRSIVVTAPRQAGELQIVQLIPSGTAVNEGDVIARFDDTSLRQTVEERESELEQAEAEIDQARAQGQIRDEENQTALLTAQYDVERARLDVGPENLVARLDLERAKLALADAEQRLTEAQRRVEADRAATQADVGSRERARDKVADDLARARRSLAALEVRAPAAGTIHIEINRRGAAPFGSQQEFREGDRAWAGAPIAELPDLSEVLLTSNLDESDRGRLRNGQAATVRVDAVPGRDFHASVANISVLARVDFAAGWPPARTFDLKLRLDDPEARLRPGMSATARIDVERLDDVLKIPAQAVFVVDGRTCVYRLAGTVFAPVPIEITKQTREAVAVARGVVVGDRVATVEPSAANMVSTP